MINKNMFVGEPTIKEYRDISLVDVLKEYLLYKGTFDERQNPCNKEVHPKELCRSALWIYGLKDNPTNRTNVVYYCERQARQNLWFRKERIAIPEEIWNECDAYNRKMCKKIIPNTMTDQTATAWVARDENGELYIGTTPPVKKSGVWVGFSEYMQLNRSRFPQVQWSDEEPTEVEITIKTKGNDQRDSH